MTGTYPTVDCVVALCNASLPISRRQFQSALKPLIAPGMWKRRDSSGYVAWGRIAESFVEMIAFSMRKSDLLYFFLSFDEETVTSICKASSTDVQEALQPYVSRLQAMANAVMVGVGFEVSAPSSLEKKALMDAGVAIFYSRQESGHWQREDFLPLIGHDYSTENGISIGQLRDQSIMGRF